jgi:hypothetical protein
MEICNGASSAIPRGISLRRKARHVSVEKADDLVPSRRPVQTRSGVDPRVSHSSTLDVP